jgi:hypothetical protein
MKNFLASQQQENFRLQKEITSLAREKCEIAEDIDYSVKKIEKIESIVTGGDEDYRQEHNTGDIYTGMPISPMSYTGAGY